MSALAVVKRPGLVEAAALLVSIRVSLLIALIRLFFIGFGFLAWALIVVSHWIVAIPVECCDFSY